MVNNGSKQRIQLGVSLMGFIPTCGRASCDSRNQTRGLLRSSRPSDSQSAYKLKRVYQTLNEVDCPCSTKATGGSRPRLAQPSDARVSGTDNCDLRKVHPTGLPTKTEVHTVRRQVGENCVNSNPQRPQGSSGSTAGVCGRGRVPALAHLLPATTLSELFWNQQLRTVA